MRQRHILATPAPNAVLLRNAPDPPPQKNRGAQSTFKKKEKKKRPAMRRRLVIATPAPRAVLLRNAPKATLLKRIHVKRAGAPQPLPLLPPVGEPLSY
jgi:hypothetical protein